MITPTIDKIIQVMNSKGFRVYDTDSVDWNLNIIGIRNQEKTNKKFDDTIIVFHKFLGNWHISYYPITTDPSDYYLKNPINADGVAILKEGQYKGVYQIDKHNGKYYALCQRLGDVRVYRDNNRDDVLDFKENSVQTGMFGINIHKGPLNGNWDSRNENYSAGCQVFADTRHFNEFMDKCKNGTKSFGNKFTYTLLNELDFS